MGHARRSHNRTHSIKPNLIARELHRHRHRRAAHRRLARVVPGQTRSGPDTCGAGDIDDRAALTLLLHVGHDDAAGEVDGAHVEVHDEVEVRVCYCEGGLASCPSANLLSILLLPINSHEGTETHLISISPPSIVDDDIDAPVCINSLLEDALPVLSFRNVRRDGLAAKLLGYGVAGFGAELSNYDLGAFGDELGGDAFAEAGAAAGDDGDFTFETAWHGCGGCFKGGCERVGVQGGIRKAVIEKLDEN
jgi:hypothetical protein